MPASERSLRLTDAYRDRLVAIRDVAGALTRRSWQQITLDDLEATHLAWLKETVTQVEAAQHSAVTLTAAYLAAYIALERNEAPQPPAAVPLERVGSAQDGRPLAEALLPTIITVKTALKDGAAPGDALAAAANRAVRLTETAALAAPRAALMDAIGADDRITGWRRVTSGGCGACLAAASETVYSATEPLKVHDHCRCTAEPVVAGAPDRVRRQTGPEMFDAMTVAQQDEALGPEAAALVRDGQIAFEHLIGTSPMKIGPDQITQAPIPDAAKSPIAAPASQE